LNGTGVLIHVSRSEWKLKSFRFENPNGDSIVQPSVDGPSRTGEERLRWVRVPQNFPTLKGLHRRSRQFDSTLSGLLPFCFVTRRSPISSANAGLNDLIPLGFSGSRGWRISRLEFNSVHPVNPVCLAEMFEPVLIGCYHGANGQTQFHRTAGLRSDPHLV
jgi:hypothetical protein